MNLITELRYLPAFIKDPPRWSRLQCWLVLRAAQADRAELNALRDIAKRLKAKGNADGDWLLAVVNVPTAGRAFFARWAWLIAPRAFWGLQLTTAANKLRRLIDPGFDRRRAEALGLKED